MKSETCPCCGQTKPNKLDLDIDFGAGVATIRGQKLRLSSMQLQFLSSLANAYPRGITRAAIHRDIYGLRADGGPALRVLDVYLCQVRNKLAAACSPVRIITAPWQGLRLHFDGVDAPSRRAANREAAL